MWPGGPVWPSDPDVLAAVQRELSAAEPPPWTPPGREVRVGACWATFPRGLAGTGAAGDPVWAAAVTLQGGRLLGSAAVQGRAGAPYRPGLLALRLGPVLEQVVRDLPARPEVLLLDATGRDHPRGAGLALHLGAALDLPSAGVTHRPLLATGEWPADRRGATSPLHVGEEVVARWLRTRPGTRPLVVHPGWRLDLDTAVALVDRACRGRRTPEPLRSARHLARLDRVRAEAVTGAR